MNVLEADRITRTYGTGKKQFTAVKGVSLSVSQGELVALLGTNGAGKTSLVEVLEGLAPPSTGSAAVFGMDPIRKRKAVSPRTGIMMQDVGFAQDLTVIETLRMWSGTLTAPRPVAEALKLVDLESRAKVRVKSLSGGERRRLDLAMATLGQPDILFLDEPTTGLDPASRRRTWELVQAMMDEGVTVLLTTHYLEEAEELADRVLIMSAGEIVTSGTVAEIVAKQPSKISFRDTGAEGRIDALTLAALPAVLGEPFVHREKVSLESQDLQTTLTALLAVASDRGVRLADLDARSASLEQAFMAVNQLEQGAEK
ncbi:MAG: ABC transporter ATP-binding protein [Ancrocorticia sp.]|uniref:ABC transporter ATP-binding protein n=1 Tax=Ancrocorticia sp. TaxID=2593684 RepID=UPI003F93E65B